MVNFVVMNWSCKELHKLINAFIDVTKIVLLTVESKEENKNVQSIYINKAFIKKCLFAKNCLHLDDLSIIPWRRFMTKEYKSTSQTV